MKPESTWSPKSDSSGTSGDVGFPDAALATRGVDSHIGDCLGISALASDGYRNCALLLWVDTSAIAEGVKREPWVADVKVDRIWPDRVVVEVLEREPAVWIEGVLGWMLVGRDAAVLERSDVPGTGLLRAALAFPDRYPGDRPVDPLWNEVVTMALVLSDDIGGTLTLEMRGVEMWTVVFGHDVRLGHPIDLADKGRTLRAMLAEEVPDGAIIDVSSPLRPALVPAESQVDIESP